MDGDGSEVPLGVEESIVDGLSSTTSLSKGLVVGQVSATRLLVRGADCILVRPPNVVVHRVERCSTAFTK
jgi:hypothetical protein